MRQALQAVVIAAAVVLLALPVWASVSGRESLTLPFVAVGLAGLCSLLAYRVAVAIRRRIDEAGTRGREGSETSDRRPPNDG
ncbi:MAG: hypothetical protein DIU80_011490 [Chloroflexota bacterium]